MTILYNILLGIFMALALFIVVELIARGLTKIYNATYNTKDPCNDHKKIVFDFTDEVEGLPDEHVIGLQGIIRVDVPDQAEYGTIYMADVIIKSGTATFSGFLKAVKWVHENKSKHAAAELAERMFQLLYVEPISTSAMLYRMDERGIENAICTPPLER